MNKLTLNDLKGGLPDDYVATTLEFNYKGKKSSVDVLIHQLPFDEVNEYIKTVSDGKFDEVAPKWIAKAYIDNKGKPVFTEKDIKQKFKPALVMAAYNKLASLSINETEIVDENEDGEGK